MRRFRFAYLSLIVLLLASWGCLIPRAPAVTPTIKPRPTRTPTPAPQVVPPPNASVTDLQSQVEAVYSAVGDSVVNIAVTTISYDFFYAIPQEGAGSGFVYDDQGHIITNYHVIEGAESIQVTFSDGVTLPGEVIGSDSTYDLAVIRVDPTTHALRPAPLGDSSGLRVGQFVIAIGAPFGLEQSVTFGIISSLGRIIESPDGERYIGEAIQTDAAINPGNSGGPLLDLYGRVIGINAQIISPSSANAGIGFAIPANTVQWVVPELIANGYYRHSWMGVRFLRMGLTPNLQQEFAQLNVATPNQGILLLEVESNSPAAKAGLRGGQRTIQLRSGELPVGGDVILAINEEPMNAPRDFIAYLESNTRVGDTVDVRIWRDGVEQIIQVTLGERP